MADLEPFDPAARRLLDAYRDHKGPSQAVQDRVRAAVLRAAAEPEVHPRARLRWLGPAVITALAAAIVAALSLGRPAPRLADASHAAAPWELSPPAPGVAGARAGGREEVERTGPEVQVTKDTPMGPASAGGVEGAPAPVGRAPEAKVGRAGPRPEPAVVREPVEDDLAAETRAMRSIQRALAEGRPADALVELAAYEGRFPAGVLREESAALHAVALCEAGREREGRGEARVFLREHGGAMLAGRVRAACGLEAEPKP